MGVGFALAAAILFGATVPLAKELLGKLSPLTLAALLYLGCGVGLAIIILVRKAAGVRPRFSPQHVIPLILSLVSGGIVAPILFVTGLARTSAVSAALMLNLEVVFTVILARFVLREAVGGRRLIGMVLVIAGAASLSLGMHAFSSFSWHMGDVLIAGAALGWALDNILTRRIADSDALVIASLKGVVAGLVDLGILFGYGESLSIPLAPGLVALFVGFVGYGLSLFFFILALRTLGAARTSTYFASAPFVGAALAAVSGQTPITGVVVAAFVLALLGIVLMTVESPKGRHSHWHRHDRGHTHAHAHGMPPRLFGWHRHHHGHKP